MTPILTKDLRGTERRVQARSGGLAIMSWAIAPLLLLTACGDDDSGGLPDFSAREARLVEEVRIDGHAELLTDIGAAAVREDGAIAFLQPQQAQVRVYSSSGDLLGTFGRRGSGPGEFGYPIRVGWLADTLWVFDERRFTFIGPDLLLVGTREVDVLAYAPAEMVAGLIRRPDVYDPSPRALDASGTIYALVRDGDEAAIGRVTDYASIERRLLPLPAPEADIVNVRPGAIGLPFANLPRFAVSPHGVRSAVVMAAVGDPDAGSFLLTVVGSIGDTVYSRRYAFEGERVTAHVADSLIAATIEGAASFPGAAAVIRQSVRVPTYHPPIVEMLIGSDSTVWIGQRTRDGRSPWYVVDPDGTPLGTLLLPRGTRLLTAERGSVWVAEPDELGVQSVVRYAVVWE